MFTHFPPRLRRHRLLICLCLLTGLLAMDGSVHSTLAQRPDSLETEMTARRDTTTTPGVERKSPSRALLYSLGGTVVPTAVGATAGNVELGAVLVLLGVGLGPSLGHFYAGNEDQALVGIGLRVGGGTLGALGAASALNSILVEEGGGGAAALLLVSGITVLISAGYDVLTAGDAAREYGHRKVHYVEEKGDPPAVTTFKEGI